MTITIKKPITGALFSKKRNIWWFFPLLATSDYGSLFI